MMVTSELPFAGKYARNEPIGLLPGYRGKKQR